MQIDLSDPRLSPSERSWLRGLERKLAEPPRSRQRRYRQSRLQQSLPADYQQQHDRMFETCGEGSG
jgi:hypothetical protein